MDETAWLVESKDKEGIWIGIEGGRYYWTTQEDKALRLSREEDANRLIEVLYNTSTSLIYKGALVPIENIWYGVEKEKE